MLYSLDAGTFKVQELLALDHEAQTALLRYAAGHLSDAANFEWLAEPGNLAYLNFAGSTYSGSLKPFMMARCINIRKALELLPVPQNVSGEAVLLITDKFLPLNNGLLKITAQNGALTQTKKLQWTAQPLRSCISALSALKSWCVPEKLKFIIRAKAVFCRRCLPNAVIILTSTIEN